jgi:hypothetical protein
MCRDARSTFLSETVVSLWLEEVRSDVEGRVARDRDSGDSADE